jgi:cytochrome c-type biogenesis protein CcmH
MSRIDELKRQIAQLDELSKAGVLSAQASSEPRTRLQAELLELGAGVSKGDDSADVLAPKTKPPFRLILGIAAFVLIFAAGTYALLGNRAGLSADPSNPGAAAASAEDASPHATEAQIEAMVERLKERLKTTPDDIEGWTMLGRSYGALGKHAESIEAYRKVIEISPRNAQAYADMADAIAVINGRSLEGEPEKIIAKALTLDPNNVKALALAGTLAFNRGQAAKAASLWERALRNVEPDNPMAPQLQNAVAEARQRAGMPALGAAAAPPAPTQAGAAAGASIQGRVTLSAKLKSQASPEDTVFIFARALQGSRAPLAILRKQVKDLPIDFTLDDSQAMSPAMRLSTAREVIIGARISKSGTATPQPGDMQGLTAAVAVGSKGVALEINEAIR